MPCPLWSLLEPLLFMVLMFIVWGFHEFEQFNSDRVIFFFSSIKEGDVADVADGARRGGRDHEGGARAPDPAGRRGPAPG